MRVDILIVDVFASFELIKSFSTFKILLKLEQIFFSKFFFYQKGCPFFMLRYFLTFSFYRKQDLDNEEKKDTDDNEKATFIK